MREYMTIIFVLLSVYELLYLIENGGSLAFILLVSFVCNAIMAWRMLENGCS